ncbi:MAG: hypothetical protein FWD64_08840 [Acidobacteriaceae bacterium]|nr:hypothetical protein [Acidobacteriaceae bacterium]
MASNADAEIMLKLYQLRQEETLRKARRFVAFEFNPKTFEELRAVSANTAAPENAWWRQAISYWEMAASLVLRGAVDADLFLDSAGEGVLIYAKFHCCHAELEKTSGRPFMRHTAQLVAKYPAAQQMFEAFSKRFGTALLE